MGARGYTILGNGFYEGLSRDTKHNGSLSMAECQLFLTFYLLISNFKRKNATFLKIEFDFEVGFGISN